MSKYLKLFYASIFILFASLFILIKFYGLGSIPQGMTQDEAYYLYDAYSINQTTKDIWGQHLPLVFKSTGEYKLNLPYLINLAIPYFGVTTTSTRMPSAIFSILSLLVIYLIICQLTQHKIISLISTFILSLSPWYFGISRLFYEANVGIFFLLTALYLAITVVRRGGGVLHYIGIGVLSALSAYFYGPYRYLGAGLIVLTFLLSQDKSIQLHLKKWLGVTLIYLLTLTPLILQLNTSASLTRLGQVTQLHQFGNELSINQNRSNCYLRMNKNQTYAKLCYLLWNKPLLFIQQATRTGIRLLSPEYLFFTSVDEYIVAQKYGAYLTYLLPFYLLGIYVIFKKSFKHKEYFLLILSLLSALIIAVSVGEVVYHRYVYGLFIIFIIISLGLDQAWQLLKRSQSPVLTFTISGLLVFLAIFQHLQFITYYYTSATIKNPLLFKYDAPEVFNYLKDYQDYTIYDNIFFAPIYAGIYWQLDPADFQANAIWAKPDKWGFTNAQTWRNLHLTEKSIEQLLCLKHKNPTKVFQTLIIDNPGKYNPSAVLLTHDFTNSLTLHAVYDLDKLYSFVLEYFPQDLCRLDAK